MTILTDEVQLLAAHEQLIKDDEACQLSEESDRRNVGTWSRRSSFF